MATEQSATLAVDTRSEPAAEAGPSIPNVALYGNLFSRVKALAFSQMVLVLGVGTVEEGPSVLMPLIETKLAGYSETDEEPEELFAQLITLENAAYILA